MFQFQCPYGHLLQADEAQAGQHSTCPLCGTVFVVPAPPAPLPHAEPTPPPPAPPSFAEPSYHERSPYHGHAPYHEELPYHQEPPCHEEPPYHDPLPTPGEEQEAAPEPPAHEEPIVPAPFGFKEPDVLHIPCPNGHVLETPVDMLDQEVLCPECQAQFVLVRTNSAEYKRERELERERRERRKGRALINFAIVVAVLVVMGVIGLILATPGD